MSARAGEQRIRPMVEASRLEQPVITEMMDSARAVSRALADLSEADLLRLQGLARLRARGLPGAVSWSDLLHEAIVRALDGSRQWPAGLPFLAFLAGVMRSLCDEIWRRRRREVALIAFGDEADAERLDVACPAPDQERVFAAIEAINSIHRLFAADTIAMRIVAGLEAGLSAEEIRATHDLSPVEYDSARRRMRRSLLRAGLSWSAS
jgi:DNA-directed RNA polymerase specialized sigma24 family protein